VSLAVKRAIPWRKVAPYMVAQVLGAFVGGALVYLVYLDAISSFEAAKHITRGTLGGAADSTPPSASSPPSRRHTSIRA
jgi:glycerol uptake facilitator protein